MLVAGIPMVPFSDIREAMHEILPPGKPVNPGFAVAVNAEKVLMARNDSRFMACIKEATLCYADGASVSRTLESKGVSSARIPGCELWLSLMKEAGRRGVPVFLVGGEASICQTVSKRLETEFSTPIVGSCDGYFSDPELVIARIRKSEAQIVSVAMGSPKQEYFIQSARCLNPSAFYMGVGGTFDVFSGKRRRAPKFLRDNDLEWLYRLAQEPSRMSRQAALLEYAVLHLLRRL